MSTTRVYVYDYEDEWGIPHMAELHYEYVPYIPAKISGPPEYCYPAEGGPEPFKLIVDGLEFSMEKHEDFVEYLAELALDAELGEL